MSSRATCATRTAEDSDLSLIGQMARYDLLDKDAFEPPWGRRFVDIQAYSHMVAEQLKLPDFRTAYRMPLGQA